MKVDYLALFVSIVSASNIIWFLPSLGNLYYLLLAAVLLFLLLHGGFDKLNTLGFLLLGMYLKYLI